MSTLDIIPRICSMRSVVESLPWKARKALILAARAQTVPFPSTSRNWLLEDQVFGGFSDKDLFVIRDLMIDLSDAFESPLWSGLIIDQVLASPASRATIDEVSLASWGKEIKALETTGLTPSLDFSTLFNLQRHNHRIHPRIPPRPHIMNYFLSHLDVWKQKVSTSTHFPRMSSKTIAKNSSDYLHYLYPEKLFDQEVTQVTLESIYSRTGQDSQYLPEDQIGVEIRQRFSRTALSPRTYFAQGWREYDSSKYIQGMMTDLVNSIPVTDHFLRLAPNRLDVSHPESYVLIYDLSSFTSNFHHYDSFLQALASYCYDTEVQLFDSYHGLVIQNLGVLLDEYRLHNSNYPPYSRRRYDHSDTVHHHQVAGFLGVYGNLMTCTFLHGLVAALVVGDIERVYCAGDDGGLVLQGSCPENREEFQSLPSSHELVIAFQCILLLGLLEWSKVFLSIGAAVALKRPFQVIDHRAIHGAMVIWPSTLLIETHENWSNPKYIHRDPVYKMINTRSSCFSAVISEINRFQRHLWGLFYVISPDDFTEIHQYLVELYEKLQIPRHGNLPGTQPLGKLLYDIPQGLNDIRQHPGERTLSRLYPGFYTMFERRELVVESVNWSVGEVFEGNSTKFLGHMVKLGYLSREERHCVYEGEEGLRLLRALVGQRAQKRTLPPVVYVFKVLEVPLHQCQLI